MNLNKEPVWKLLLMLLTELILFAIPVGIIAVMIIAFMRACGNMPY